MEAQTKDLGTRLEEALERLESAAGSAVVPGELGSWGGAVRAEHAAVEPVLAEALRHEVETREAIRAEDAGLMRAVTLLREGAEKLERRFRRLGRELDALLARETTREGSAEPTDALEELRRRALEWIVALRAHRAEVRTWYQESVLRDRGESG